jgi:hypothetical protein
MHWHVLFFLTSKKKNPESRVVAFDSATSHVTPKCRQSVNDFGIWDVARWLGIVAARV